MSRVNVTIDCSMREAAKGETLRDILDATRVKGFHLSAAKIHRWRLEGLIDEPFPVGHGRARGVTGMYPVGTAERAAAIAGYLQQTRNFKAVWFLLWWNGHEVPDFKIREQLLANITEILGRFKAALQGKDPKEAKRLLKRVRTRHKDQLIKNLRKVVGGQREFEQLMNRMCEIAAGFPAKLSQHDIFVFARAFNEELNSVASTLNIVSSVLNPDTLLGVIQKAPWSELRLARDQLKFLRSKSAEIAKLAARLFGSNPIIEALTVEWPIGLYLDCMLVWLSLRKQSQFEAIWNECNALLGNS